jgi:hypothetical protein
MSLAARQAAVMSGRTAPAGSRAAVRAHSLGSSSASDRRPVRLGRVWAMADTEVESAPTLQTGDSNGDSERPSNREARDRPRIVRAADKPPGTPPGMPLQTKTRHDQDRESREQLLRARMRVVAWGGRTPRGAARRVLSADAS